MKIFSYRKTFVCSMAVETRMKKFFKNITEMAPMNTREPEGISNFQLPFTGERVMRWDCVKYHEEKTTANIFDFFTVFIDGYFRSKTKGITIYNCCALLSSNNIYAEWEMLLIAFISSPSHFSHETRTTETIRAIKTSRPLQQTEREREKRMKILAPSDVPITLLLNST